MLGSYSAISISASVSTTNGAFSVGSEEGCWLSNSSTAYKSQESLSSTFSFPAEGLVFYSGGWAG